MITSAPRFSSDQWLPAPCPRRDWSPIDFHHLLKCEFGESVILKQKLNVETKSIHQPSQNIDLQIQTERTRRHQSASSLGFTSRRLRFVYSSQGRFAVGGIRLSQCMMTSNPYNTRLCSHASPMGLLSPKISASLSIIRLQGLQSPQRPHTSPLL